MRIKLVLFYPDNKIQFILNFWRHFYNNYFYPFSLLINSLLRLWCYLLITNTIFINLKIDDYELNNLEKYFVILDKKKSAKYMFMLENLCFLSTLRLYAGKHKFIILVLYNGCAEHICINTKYSVLCRLQQNK